MCREPGSLRHRIPGCSEERQQTLTDDAEIRWCTGNLVSAQITAPPLKARVVGIEPRRQSQPVDSGKSGIAAFEGSSHGACEVLALEGTGLSKRMKIVKILVATVSFAEYDHRVELLGHDGFARVNQDSWRGSIEQSRIVSICRGRLDRVPKADIDLHPYSRTGYSGLEACTETAVLGFVHEWVRS